MRREGRGVEKGVGGREAEVERIMRREASWAQG